MISRFYVAVRSWTDVPLSDLTGRARSKSERLAEYVARLAAALHIDPSPDSAREGVTRAPNSDQECMPWEMLGQCTWGLAKDTPT